MGKNKKFDEIEKHKIGILTLFYKNYNYGGILQSFALYKILQDDYGNVEQISYDFSKENKINKKIIILLKIKIKKIIDFFFANFFDLRRKRFLEFINKYIPHSRVYDIDDIKMAVDKYDIFVVGSDQIWNFDWGFRKGFLLNFVPKEKVKVAYAASMGKNKITSSEKEIFRKSLNNFNAISVREKDAVSVLQPLVCKKVEVVLDPTLLLTKNEWEKIVADRLIQEAYVFCYFLGDDKQIRKIAKQYAQQHDCKIVVLPHIHHTFEISDMGFGDIKLYDVSPSDFISLIKYSNYVFTDSFHASCFSCIYQKDFVVFDRLGAKEMSTRLDTLTSLFNCEERFCNSEERFNIEYIEKLKTKDYSGLEEKIDEERKKSLQFLKKALSIKE